MTDGLVLYKEMARAIADEARIELTFQEKQVLASTRQVNPKAYEAYNKRMFHLYKLTLQDIELALGHFELALEKDPNFALAYVGISLVWGGYAQQGFMPASEAIPKSEEALKRALELDDTLKEVHYLLAVRKT